MITINNHIKNILQIWFDDLIEIKKVSLQCKEWKYGSFVSITYKQNETTFSHKIFLSDIKYQRDEKNLQQVLLFCESIKDLREISEKTNYDIDLLFDEINDHNETYFNN